VTLTTPCTTPTRVVSSVYCHLHMVIDQHFIPIPSFQTAVGIIIGKLRALKIVASIPTAVLTSNTSVYDDLLKKGICNYLSNVMGRDNSVGIAIRYWLDGPEIESRWARDFPHLSRPALGATQPPIQWVPGLSRG